MDHFKRYNDSCGHQQGDQCLRTIAQAFKNGLNRAQEFVARYGGEEFAAVLPFTSGEGAQFIAEQFQDAIKELAIPHPDSPTGDYVTVSFGIACGLPTPDHPIEHFFQAADRALYAAKHRGRDRYVVTRLGENQPIAKQEELDLADH